MAQLGRHIGLIEALAIGIGSMIGAGIFVLSGSAAQAAGPAVSISFALSGLAVLLTALSFVELATAMPKAGGPYIYVREAFGRAFGFFIGWSLWVGLALATAFYAMGFAQYLLFFGPPTGTAAAFVVLAIFGVNLVGQGKASKVQNVLVALLLAVIAFYIVAGWSAVDRALHRPFLPYGWEPVISTASSVFVSFLGFELIATAAEEMRNPGRDLPLATILSIVGVTTIYVLVLHVATGLLPYFALGETRTPIADTALRSIGPWGAVIAVAGGLLATLSSANTSMMASSRIGWAMARDGLLPAPMASVHRRWQSPHVAVGVTAAIIIVCLMSDDLVKLAGAAGFLHLYPFLAVNLALLKLRGRPDHSPTFRVPGGPVLPLIGAASTVALLAQVAWSDIAWGAALVVPGIAYYALARATSRLGPT